MLSGKLSGVAIQALRALCKKKKLNFTTDFLSGAAKSGQLVNMLRDELDGNQGLIPFPSDPDFPELEDTLSRCLSVAEGVDYSDTERPITVILAMVIEALSQLAVSLEADVEELESRLSAKHQGLHVVERNPLP